VTSLRTLSAKNRGYRGDSCGALAIGGHRGELATPNDISKTQSLGVRVDHLIKYNKGGYGVLYVKLVPLCQTRTNALSTSRKKALVTLIDTLINDFPLPKSGRPHLGEVGKSNKTEVGAFIAF
jgi:hypothetical protein